MVPELRPRGIGEQLDVAVVLYRRAFKRLILATVAVIVPVQVFSTLVLLSAEPDSFQPNLTGGMSPAYDDGGSQLVRLAAVVVILVVSVLSTAFVSAVCTRIAADAYVERHERRGEAFQVVVRRVFAVLGLSILLAMAQGAGLAVCFFGVVVPITLFAVAVPVLLLEETGVFQAMGRSVELTKSHFPRVLGLVATAQLLAALLNYGLAIGVAVVFRNDGGTSALVITQGLANTVAAVLTTPLLAAAIVSCYFDLRIRNEAFDVQLLMQHNDSRRASDRPAMPPAAAR